jgi:Protein kinase domain
MASVTSHRGDSGRRLVRAAATRAAIDHPNLLGAKVARTRDGRVSVRLESCSAPTLAQALTRGPLSARNSMRILRDVATAVHVLARHGLMARDLTPKRIRLDPSRGAILADHGIPFDLLPRTPSEVRRDVAYRSPEELEGRAVDARSSVYSLGAILYTTLTGARPPESKPGWRPGGQQVELPAPIAAVVARAMAREPADRYADVRELTRAALVAFRMEGAAPPRAAATPPKPGPAAPAPREDPAPHAATSAPRERPAPPPAEQAPAERPAPASSKSVTPGPKRSRMPRLRLPAFPRLRMPALPRPRLSAIPRPRLRTPELPRLRAPKLPRPRLRAPGRPATLAIGTGAAVIGCVVAGVMLGRSVGDEAQASQITSSALTVQVPEGWERTEVVRDRAINLSAPVAAAPLGDRGVGLVVGRVSDTVTLDRRFRDELGASEERTEVHLGRLQAWRYEGLRLGTGLVGTAYLAPTTGGPLLVLCHARQAGATPRLMECERMAATIALRGERPVPLSSVDTRDERIDLAMTTLRRDRRTTRRRLARAKLAGDQAKAARAVEQGYRRAARNLEAALPASDSDAYEELVASLEATADAYRELARAARRTNRTRYRRAIEAVREQEEAVSRAAAAPESA